MRIFWPWFIYLAAVVGSPVLAAGGSHVIDDYGVETPGVCNSELIATRLEPSVHSGKATLNCTTRALPAVEFGLALVHLNDDGTRETLLGPGLKWKLREPGNGPGLALAGIVQFGLETGRLEKASIILPISFALSDRLMLNLNAGWVHARLASPQDTVKVGAQAIVRPAPEWTLMVEGFTELDNPAGAQAGMRWTPGQGAVDVDLTIGHRVDGVADLSVAGGLIIRF